MCKRAKRWGMALALAVALSVGFAGMALAAEGQQDQMLALFRQGVTAYQTGEYAKARDAFDQVLAMEPGLQAALMMRDEAEFSDLVKMRDNPELAKQADMLLDLIMRAARESRRRIEDPGKLLADFQSPQVATYTKALVELKGHGPYAVPFVVKLLALKDQPNMEPPGHSAIVARTYSLLASLPRDAVLPLVQVLLGTNDSLVQTRVAGVLGQIKDKRAIPALLQVWRDPKTLPPVKEEAGKAIAAISGTQPQGFKSAADEYINLGLAYLYENKPNVGYTYGLTADVWMWNAAASDDTQKVSYEEVPNYLYYQRMAMETALAGLAVDPADIDLQALLAAALVRRLALCEFYKSETVRVTDPAEAQKIKADAASRATVLEVQVPVALDLLPTPVVSRALELTLQANDGPASLYLVKALAAKLKATGAQMPAQETIAAQMAALDSGDKDVRYNAAVNLVSTCPTGKCGNEAKVMQVLGEALRAAASRNALVIMSNFQVTNSLVTIVRNAGVATVESRPDARMVEYALSMQPSVDIVFLTANVDQPNFDHLMRLLQEDARTKKAPIYAVADPNEATADMAKYTAIQKVLTPEHVRATVIGPILQEKVLAESRSAFTEQEEALVLKAVMALRMVDPQTTTYPYAVLEPALLKALSGYSDEVSMAVIGALREFSSQASLEPLAAVVAGDKSVEIKVAACRAVAAVLKRTQGAAADKLVQTLKDALMGKEQSLREAAAEALSAAGLKADELIQLVRTQALATK